MTFLQIYGFTKDSVQVVDVSLLSSLANCIVI